MPKPYLEPTMTTEHDPRPYARDLERIANALERLCEHFCPAESHRERRPATLTKASYRREGDTPEAWAEVEASGKRPLPVNAKVRSQS